MVGANKKEEAFLETRKATIFSVIANGSVSLLIYIFADPLFSLFVSKDVLDIAKNVMLIDFVLEIGRAINMTMVRCLQAVGDIKFPILCGILSMWFISIPIAYYLGIILNMGLVGIWLGMAIDECFRGILFVIRWESGKWRKKELIKDII